MPENKPLTTRGVTEPGHYPAFLDLHGKPCLVIGTGAMARRQCRQLVSSGAHVTVIAEQDTGELPSEIVFQPQDIDNFARKIENPDKENNNHDSNNNDNSQWATEAELGRYWLVFSDSGSQTLDDYVARICNKNRTFCSVARGLKHSSFFTPALIDRSPLLVAIGTGGAAPALSRSLKARLEATIPQAVGDLALLIERYTSRVAEQLPDRADRARYWHDLLEKMFSTLAYTAGLKNVQARLEEFVSTPRDEELKIKKGSVALVGAGPGAPDLLTFRALRLLQYADVIVHDRLVSPEILELCRPDAQMIYAGKAKSDHAIAQTDINSLLVTLAEQGKTVVRLKGGDPFIFGRGGEEIETLAACGVEFQVVPGITAASGCAAFAGIPLTHRDHAQSCVFVTGHLQDSTVNLNWNELKDPSQTIVVYMGLTGLETICRKLIAVGRDANTPAALVERGTTLNHRVHAATLETLPGLVQTQSVKAPTLLIIGSVVSLREKLNWYDPDQLP